MRASSPRKLVFQSEEPLTHIEGGLSVSAPPHDRISPDSMAVIANSEFVEALYEQWKEDPSSLSREWQMFFQGFELAMCPRNCVASDQAQALLRVVTDYARALEILDDYDHQRVRLGAVRRGASAA